MQTATSTALAVKELEPGQFHWLLLREKPAEADDEMGYDLLKISQPYPDPAAAWTAGYLALRAMMRRAAEAQ